MSDTTRARELLAELQALVGADPASAPKKAKVAKSKATKKAAPKSATPKGGIPHLSAAAPKALRELNVGRVINVKGSMSAYNKAIAGRGGSFRNVEDQVSENGSIVRVYERRATQTRPNPDNVQLLVCTQENWIKRTR